MLILPKESTYSARKKGARGRCIFWSSTFLSLASMANTGCSSFLRSSQVLSLSFSAPAAGTDFFDYSIQVSRR